MKTFIYSLCIVSILATACNENCTERTPVDYVCPYIGNISHLLVPTFPTVQLPNSMLRVYPNRENYTGDLIDGLPLIVTGHRGGSAFRLNPVNVVEDGTTKGYSYGNEKITPYRYSVDLDEEEIGIDFAPSHHSAVYSFRFRKGNGNIVLSTRSGKLEVTESGVQGYQDLENFRQTPDGKVPARVYLYVETEQKAAKTAVLETSNERSSAVALTFDSPSVNIRYGVSYISTEQAKKHLNREIAGYDVNKLAQTGRDKWNEALGKIKVEGTDEDAKTVFYTSLYRTYERMVNISEDGQYFSAADHQIHSDDGRSVYTDDWIWDTYRAVHPLRVIIEPEMEQDMLRSYILLAEQSTDGWLPTFPGIQGDGHAMNGNHSIASICDAYTKGLQDFDIRAGLKVAARTMNERSLIPWSRVPATELDKIYREKGYFPALEEGEKETVKEVSWERRQTVAVTLAACYDEWCVAQIAKSLGDEANFKEFNRRSFNYRNIYNAQTGFFHPKNKSGNFIEPFDYRFSGGPGSRDYYDENNGWIYRWDVQHNIADLIELMGGKAQFIKNLDQTFREPLGRNRYNFYYQHPDHTGNVGQYSMGNEPCLHIPYLYCYAGQPWKTQKRVRTLLTQWFRNDLMGIPGDEDGGGMTAFVVFSSLGFYPVTPGLPMYVIGSPVFEKSSVQLANGKAFTVQCINYAPENLYIQSARFNGQAWNQPWFSHQDMMQGGTLELTMGNTPNKAWGAASVPPSYEMNK
ncbi:MAG: GH92 family glycosyl hydrolase [Bacteroidales bacterium]|jgi:predicted alpha-1,2-mannosidase|nr:GH92 family glycosyl hydrolase [Bacteroidales bacterium]